MNSPFPILVVDDDAAVQQSLQLALESEFDPHLAGSAAEAESILKRREIFAAVVDIGMPGISGVELLRRIKGAWPLTEVVMLTADTDLSQAIACTEAGAFRYLNKPTDLEQLRRVLDEACGQYLARRTRVLGAISAQPDYHVETTKTKMDPATSAAIAHLVETLLPNKSGSVDLAGVLKEIERRLLLHTLTGLDWNQTAAAKALKMHRYTLQRKIKEYKIPSPGRRL